MYAYYACVLRMHESGKTFVIMKKLHEIPILKNVWTLRVSDSVRPFSHADTYIAIRV